MSMKNRRNVFAIAVATLLSLGAVMKVSAQTSTLTGKNIRIVVPAPAGTAPDVIARLLADSLAAQFKSAVVVDNKPGAGGLIAVRAVTTAPADGTTLMLPPAAVVAVAPLIMKTATFDFERDFETVASVANTPMLFVANPDKGPKTMADLVAKAKAKADDLTVGNPSRGSIPHLAAVIVEQNRGVEFRHVPYGATAQAIQSVVNGDTMASVDGVAVLLPLVKAGRIRALAVTSPRVMPGLEGIPLANETVPGMDVSGWFALFAPKGTPVAVLNELNAATNVMLKTPEAIAKMAALGNYPMGGSVADAAAFVKREKATWAAVVRKAGIEAE
jgi:tripartite-type tricarboxylate transporter receptor subunit TctC